MKNKESSWWLASWRKETPAGDARSICKSMFNYDRQLILFPSKVDTYLTIISGSFPISVTIHPVHPDPIAERVEDIQRVSDDLWRAFENYDAEEEPTEVSR